MTARFEEQHDETMDAIVRAMETASTVRVPADFAARVMARVPETTSVVSLRRAHALTPRYGRMAAYTAMAFVLAVMLLVARTHGMTSAGNGLQLVLVLQLSAYVLWMGLASWRSQ